MSSRPLFSLGFAVALTVQCFLTLVVFYFFDGRNIVVGSFAPIFGILAIVGIRMLPDK